jgi:type I restriction enzyme R subunit
LVFVLDQYIKEGVGELDKEKLIELVRAKYYTMEDAAQELDGMPETRETFIGFQQYLYE